MSYVKADEVLPQNIIAIIQQYIDGESIYIPKRNNTRAKWGKKSGIKKNLNSGTSAFLKIICLVQKHQVLPISTVFLIKVSGELFVI